MSNQIMDLITALDVAQRDPMVSHYRENDIHAALTAALVRHGHGHEPNVQYLLDNLLDNYRFARGIKAPQGNSPLWD